MQTDGGVPMRPNGNVFIDQRLVGRRIDLFARALISDTHGRFLLVKARNLPDGQWEMPGGSVQDGESCTTSIIRRLREDLGILTWPVSVVFIQDRCCKTSKRHLLSITYSVSVLSGELQVNCFGQLDDARWFEGNEVSKDISDEAVEAIRSRQTAAIMVS